MIGQIDLMEEWWQGQILVILRFMHFIHDPRHEVTD